MRPAHDGVPGHPVVLPTAPLLHLRGEWPGGPMRALLAAAAQAGTAALRVLAIDDPGTIADRDGPADPAPADEQEDDIK